eukprot:3702028-Alexandrium_andersonii.AAC.1
MPRARTKRAPRKTWGSFQGMLTCRGPLERPVWAGHPSSRSPATPRANPPQRTCSTYTGQACR